MTVKGIDVSSHQSADYSTAGLDFVFIKITEGVSYTNPKWIEQRATARKAGLVTGFYHFVRPGSMSRQVDYFLSKIKLVAGDVLALDWEDSEVGNAAKDTWIKDCRKKAPGHKVVLYCNQNFWLHRDTTSFAGDGLWIADYVTAGKPRIKAKWLFHQYTSTPIDRNIGDFADRAALRKWAGAASAPAEPSQPAKPSVSLAALVRAARNDPAKHGTPVSYAGVKTVEKALVAEGLLAESLADGHFGTATVQAYAAWQRRCGFTGDDANGIPGERSLAELGAKHGFKAAT